MIQPDRGGSIGGAVIVLAGGLLMSGAYFNAALIAMKYDITRRSIGIDYMSNNLGLSDIKKVDLAP